MIKTSVICSLLKSESYTPFHKVRKQFFCKKCIFEFQMGGPFNCLGGPLKFKGSAYLFDSFSETLKNHIKLTVTP
jgi:hypothetical protein